MGLAIDTVGFSITGAQATLTPATVASGDSFTIRNFVPPSFASLEAIFYQATTTGSVQVKSPMFHDDVRGIQFTTKESPSVYLLPPAIGQQLVTQDTLTVSMSGGATSETDVGALSIYYSNLSGAAARLHMWSDISGIVKSIKPVEVDTSAGTAGAWQDVAITTTENLLHANTDYAVLGYVVDVASAAVGIRGIDTGNLRVCGPGTTATDDTSMYFVNASNMHNTPHIPVFNSANMFSTFVSVFQATTTAVQKVQLVLAELSQRLPT